MRRPYYQAPRPPVGRTQPPIFTTPINAQQQHNANHKLGKTKSESAVAQRRRQQQKMADPECSGFEPQNYLRDRCKKCFRFREKHEGMTNFMRTPGDHHKDTEIVIRSQLRSPIVTVRRAQSNPAKMLTTATALTTSSSSTRKTSLQQQQQHNNNSVSNNNINQKKRIEKKQSDEEGRTTFVVTRKSAQAKQNDHQETQMRNIAIESDESIKQQQQYSNNVNRTPPVESSENEPKKIGLICVPLAEEGAAKPIVCGGRRTWKLSSHDTTKSQAVNKNVVEKDDENARFLQQSIASKKQNSAQSRPSSATTTVLLSKQHQISLGHSNSLHEQRKSLKSSVACCSSSAENGLTPQSEQTGAKGDNDEARISSSARRTALKEQQQKQENSGRKRFSERNGSWQFMGDKFVSTAGQQQNGVKKHHELNSDDETEEEEEEEEELLSLSSYKSANSIMERSAMTNATTTVDEMFSARSVESLTSLSCADSFKTGKSPPFDDPMEDPFMTPKSMSEAQHFFGSDDEFERAMTPTAIEFKQQEFFHLRGENRRLMEQCRHYRHERKRWTEWLRKRYGNWKEKERDNGGKREQQQTTTVAVDGKRLMEDALTEMETMLNEYRDENSELKGKLMEKRDGLIHDRDMMSASASTVISNGTCTGPVGAVVLEERLQMSESMCEQLRRDRKELEREIEEMQDQYRVEEIEEFRELQRELEQSAKNGRILQFKLRKAERQRDQLQAEKNLLARKVQEVQRGVGGDQRDGNDSMAEEEEQMGRRVTELEQELRVSKEVSLKLHNELEVAEEKRYKLEDELFYQKEKVRELLAQNRWREARQAKGRSVEEALLEASRSAENLPKEVRDTLEREADLREQLRFTEADLQRTRQRLHELERENDELLQRYSNLAERHSEVQSKAAAAVPPTILLTPSKQKTILRSISDGTEEASSASQKQHCNKSDGRKTDELHGRSASAAETNRTPVDKEKVILMEKSEESNKKLSTMAEEVNELRRKCAECEREIGELRESAVSYKQMNGELKERMGRLRDEWEAIEKRREANSVEKVQKALKELKDARKQLDIECLKRESAERSLAENRAVLEKLNATIIETNAELNRSRQRVGELDQEQDKLKKWEGRCKEMKLERVRIQANAMELKKRTDEAVQELGKMSRAHQQKEIGWMREKKQFEEQLRELTKTTASKTIAESGSQSSTTTTSSGSQQRTMDRIEELEQEKKCLEAKMEELKKIREQELAAYQTQKQQWQKEREQIVAKNQKMGGADSHTNVPLTNDRPDVDYKQIADNALRAAETLQKQYREYQKHYTAEVQRLSGNLVKLEQELAMRQQQQITTIVRADTGADQKPDENNNENDTINVSAVIKMPAQHQAQHLTRTRRGYESPSLSSLTDNNFTDNTTWDSRMLDCGSMMTRSISPLKAHSSAPKVPTAVPMLQCRPVEIHPSSPLAGLGQRGIAVTDDGDFGSVDDVQQKYRRTGSAGTNILYRIRREELAQGKHPTVRQMARAFESFEKLQQKGNSSEEPKRKRVRQTKGGLFGLLGKSSSMEVSSMSEKNLKTPKAFRKGERTTSESVPLATERIGIRGGGGSPSPMPSSTLPRGGRNPFKGFSSRIVERVRRSLSRSKKSQSRDGGPSRDGTPSLNITAITADGLKWN